MSSQYSQSVQVVLLFDNKRAFDAAFGDLKAVCGTLAEQIKVDEAWTPLDGASTPTCQMMSSEERHFSIERFDARMAQDGFVDVLSNPVYAQGAPDLCKAVKGHTCALMLQVAPGAVPGFGAALAQSGLADLFGAEEGVRLGLSSASDYEDRMLLAQIIASCLITYMMPSAVHWGQSQKLFTGRGFIDAAQGGFSLPLYVGSMVVPGGTTPQGEVKAGVRGFGTQFLVGKMVMVDPDVQPWSQSYELICTFVTYCRSIGRVLQDHESFSMGEGDGPVIRVRHMADIPQLPEGYIVLHIDRDTLPENSAKTVVRADAGNMQDALDGAPAVKTAEEIVMDAMYGSKGRPKPPGLMQQVRRRLPWKSALFLVVMWMIATSSLSVGG
jgi:hypothetical protein